jgi:RNA polymerase sigma-B factor
VEPCGSRFRLGRAGVIPAVEPDVWRLHVRYRRDRCAEARAELVHRYLPHAQRLAARYYRRGEPREDLEQVAVEGLVAAIDRFDHERQVPFLGFATPTISGTIKRYIRDSGWSIRVPRRVHDLAPAVRDAEAFLAQELGRPPLEAEIADLVGVDESVLAEVRRASTARTAEPVDALDPAERSALGSVDADLGRVVDRRAIEQAVGLLPADRRELLGLYFEDGLTQDEIAERLGVSQMHVSRTLRAALVQLRSRVPGG